MKKILSLAIACALSVGTAAFANGAFPEADYLVEKGYLFGTGNGLETDRNATNAEALTMLYRISGKEIPQNTARGAAHWAEPIIEDAKEKGYIKTMFGRIRPIPELSSSNFMQRQFGERVAMNSPIQGTAADIIKIAMIRVHDRLLKENLKSKLILQVHDELLIETAEDEKKYVIELLEEEMHKAADLKVSMEVGTECGYDWYDAH